MAFGASPISFLLNAYEKYGPVFSFTMVGQTFTYLLGTEASTLFFNSKNEDLNAEEVYSKLTTPVFGEGVAYDVPNARFMEQKKIFKTGLNIARFRMHVPIIEQETREYFKSWADAGEKDLFEALSQLIILTSSHCLHGPEIRKLLNESDKIAKLYQDLDGGFTHAAWLLPGWIPFPSFIKRDKANAEMQRIFIQIVQKRRQSEPQDDMLQTLIDSTYKSGDHLTDKEVVGMLIGLLMAGQHTSSTTSSWMGFFLAKNKHIQQDLYEEQRRVWPKDAPLNYDHLKNMNLLDRCVKETLRMRPPLMTMMRLCKRPLQILGFTIPPGHQVCVSPPVNHRIKDTWGPDAEEFNPDRFLDISMSTDKFKFVPFGAGRHRCIGEYFAFVQIKAIWSVLLRKYEFELVDGHFPPINFNTMIHTPVKPIIRYRKRSES